MNFRWRASALGALVGTILVLGGCSLSQSPLSPGAPAGNPGTSTPPPIVSFGPGGALGYVWAPAGDQAGAPLKAGTLTPRFLISASVIDGSRGGTVRAGRFSVMLPPGAFSGLAGIAVSMSDSTVMICDLTITPASANKFKIPAQLTADLSSPGLIDAAAFTTYWYDPAKAAWVNLFAKSTVNGTSITTTLDHFSRYAAGKAGW